MNDIVIRFLKALPKKREDQFDEAFVLLRKSAGINSNLLRNYNLIGATEGNVVNLLYDLKKIYGISEASRGLVRIKKKPLQSKGLIIK
ncbi:hypothetical protein [Flavobacterium sp. JP2137]|uniref:hypothetical protein n=1 Tax=Flavobacterium sp. JP2137 TaxID=3414510 RepID=UPI003D2FF69A